MTAPALTAPELLHLDPAVLLADRNIRAAEVDADFQASVAELGVLVPIVGVRTGDGQVRVRMGHRRRLAAIGAGLPDVPVLVVAGETDADADRIVAQYAENTQRQPLTAAEEARAVQDLLDLGVDIDQIERKTRLGKDAIAAAQAVARSAAARKAAQKHRQLTLDQAAGIAEFDTDKEAVSRLIQCAVEGYGFTHELQRRRDDRAATLAREAATVKLTKAGVPIMEGEYWDTRNRKAERLTHLTGADGAEITPRVHKDCPGHIAYLQRTYDARAGVRFEPAYFCADPAAHGHKKRYGDSSGGPQVTADERREVVAGNKAWRSARTVRRDWLASLAARTEPPDGALSCILRALLDGPPALTVAMGNGHQDAQALLGLPCTPSKWGRPADSRLGETFDAAPPGRQLVMALVLVLAAGEAELTDSTWRGKSPAAAAYLRQLAAWGYETSEIEQAVITAAHGRVRRAAATRTGTEDTT